MSPATSPAIPLAIPLKMFKSILAYSVFGLRSSKNGSGRAVALLVVNYSYTSSYTSSYVSGVTNLSKSLLMPDKFYLLEFWNHYGRGYEILLLIINSQNSLTTN